MTPPPALGVAVVAAGPRSAARRVAWAAAALATAVPVRVVLVTPCWREAVAHPGVDVVDLGAATAPHGGAIGGVTDTGAVVSDAAAAGRYVVVGDPGTGEGGTRPPAWAGGPGGWTVADLPLRCVPAVRLAAAMVADGALGELCRLRVRGHATAGVVDLVHVVSGQRMHPAPRPAGRRLAGVLGGGAVVTVEEPAAGGGLRLEVIGDAGRMVVDLRRPLGVRVASAAASGVVTAAEPRHARSRRPGSHLAVDAIAAIVLGRDGVGTYDDAVAAARVLSDGLEAGGEVPQGRRLVDDPVPAKLAGA